MEMNARTGRPEAMAGFSRTRRNDAQKLKFRPLSATEVVHWIAETSHRRRLIVGANLHALYLMEKDIAFRTVYERADLVLADGFPVAVATRVSPTRPAVPRLGSTDWLARIGDARQALRVAVIGASPESNAQAIQVLADRSPEHTFRGWDGYEGSRRLVEGDLTELKDFGPDLVVVGMGMPVQEAWIAHCWDEMPEKCTVALVGGAVDQISGHQRLAPRWLGNMGLEWLWRLALQPRRLAHRYLVEPVLLSLLVATRRWREGPRAAIEHEAS